VKSVYICYCTATPIDSLLRFFNIPLLSTPKGLILQRETSP
jgi:hypothetical protein